MKRKLGFGLIEMLVVVGAISALAAIGYPTVEKSFEKSKESNDITAMQSADSLITSAALSGKVIGGKPARDYTRDHPLYFDEAGNLVAAQPVGYGRGTAKSGGEVWSSCDDYEYDPFLDYTGAYIVCWYDSDTRIAHVHWSVGNTSGGTPSATAPTYATFPTRPTTEPTEKEDPDTPNPSVPSGSEETTSSGHYHEFSEVKQGSTTSGVKFQLGHRYMYNDTIYIANTNRKIPAGKDFSPDSQEYWKDFIPLQKPQYYEENDIPQTVTEKKYPQVFQYSKNVLEDGKNIVYNNRITEWNNENRYISLQRGDYFIDDSNPKDVHYYVFNNENGASTLKWNNGNRGNWTEIVMNCSTCSKNGVDDFWIVHDPEENKS